MFRIQLVEQMDPSNDPQSHCRPAEPEPGEDGARMALPKRKSSLAIPSNSHILERLYNDHGVRVRMVRRGRPRIPTVKELIDQLSKKHETLLELEMKGRQLEKPSMRTSYMTPATYALSRSETMRMETLRALSDTYRGSSEIPRTVDTCRDTRAAEQDTVRCLSERPAKFEVWEPDVNTLKLSPRDTQKNKG